MEIDYSIERIENGYIFTGNDSTKVKRYFGSIQDFVTSEILEPLKEEDRSIKEHQSEGRVWRLKVSFGYDDLGPTTKP